MTPEITEILVNREVIAIDQDKGGKQGTRLSQSGELEIWTRQLAGGDIAVAMFNRGGAPANITVRWSQLGLTRKPSRARDLWAHSDIAPRAADYTTLVPAHGVAMLRVGR
jgi:alpha-galactosidase